MKTQRTIRIMHPLLNRQRICIAIGTIENYHSEEQIIGNPSDKVSIGSAFSDQADPTFISELEPKTIDEVLMDNRWILPIQEELNQLKRSDAWTLVPLPEEKFIIGTKLVFRNKLDENGKVVRNNARLDAQGYPQEGI